MPRPAQAVIFLLVPLCACSGPITIPAPWDIGDPASAEAPAPNFRPGPPSWARVGSSVRGKQIVAATVGEGPYRVYIIGGIAGDEPEGPVAAERLPPELFRTLPPGVAVRVVRDMNPDGSAARARGNTRGVDLTRNWPHDHISGPRHGTTPASELETTNLQKDLAAFNPNLVIIFRSSARGPMAAMAGPGPFLASPFVTAARSVDPRWRALPQRWTAEAGTPEAYIAATLGRPVITVEFPRGRDAVTNAAAARAGILAAAERGAPPTTALPPAPVAQQSGQP